MNYETRTLKIAVMQENEPIFDNSVTEIKIADEATGEFVEVSQCNDDNEGKIKIDPTEWPHIREAINKMIKECRNNK
jgi:hypothetical protein